MSILSGCEICRRCCFWCLLQGVNKTSVAVSISSRVLSFISGFTLFRLSVLYVVQFV
jgi:hypothetical protein